MGPALLLKDSAGTLVGPMIAPGRVTLRLNGDVVVLPVAGSGFIQDDLISFNNYLFTGPNCTGNPVFNGGPPAPGSDGLVTNVYQIILGVAYWPHGLPGAQTIQSQRAYTDPATCSQNGGTVMPLGFCCYSFAPKLYSDVQIVGAFDLSTLGLMPPFHVEGP